MSALQADVHTLRHMALTGDEIRARRMALGMTVKALAERAGVDRGQLSKIEAGASARTSTLGAIEQAIAQIEEEVSGPYDAEPDNGSQVTFRLKGNFGVDVTVEGPVSDLEALEASVSRLIARMGEQQTP